MKRFAWLVCLACCGKGSADSGLAVTVKADDKALALHITGKPGTYVRGEADGYGMSFSGANTLDDKGVLDVSVPYEWKAESFQLAICDGDNRCTAKQTVARPKPVIAIETSSRGWSCTGVHCTVEVIEEDNNTRLRLEAYGPVGMVLDTQGQHAAVTDEHYPASVTLAMPGLDTVTLAQLAADVDVSFTLTFADGTKASAAGKHPMKLADALDYGLENVDKRPVLFGAETATPSKDRVLYVWGKRTYVGAATKPTDIDLVAKFQVASRNHDCGMYKNTTTDADEHVFITLNDVTDTVYERRTGKVRGKRTWTAVAPPCVKERADNGGTVVAKKDGEEAWLKSFVKP